MSDKAQYPIGVVSRRTGLHPDVIRAWERRYGAVTPVRTTGNRRLYRDADIRRLSSIRRAVNAGFRTGNVATLSVADIESLIDGDTNVRPMPKRRREGIDYYVQRCFDHIVALDAEALEREFEAASVELSRIVLMDRLMVPLMERVGEACADGRCRIANEHLATTVTRSFLDSVRGAYPAAKSAPGIVVTTPARQHHELAAMVVAANARAEGWRTVYLGSNLPAEDIAATVKQCGARAVALSITWPGDDADLVADLKKLGRLLPDDVVVIAGGRSVAGYAGVLDAIDARRPVDLRAFRELLQTTRSGETGHA